MELSAIEKETRNSRRVVNTVAFLVVAAYMVWFALCNSSTLSADTAEWGQLGDYIGGLLNPLVAYFAFYWLTRSVALQQRELLETKDALREAAKAQERQAVSSNTSLRVSALTAMINSVMVEVQVHRSHIQFVLDQANRHHSGAARDVNGTVIENSQIPAYLKEINDRIQRRLLERLGYEDELKVLLNKQAQIT